MEVKLFELRDRGTFVPAIAIRLHAQNEAERYLLSRAGYGQSNSEQGQYVLLAGLEGGAITYDQHSWGNRTRQVAHDHIIKYFDELINGQVIDVEYILGEKAQPKDSEALTS